MGSTDIGEPELKELMNSFVHRAFDASVNPLGPLDQQTASICEQLFRLDYSIVHLDNTNGTHSSRYPPRIFIPEYEHGEMGVTTTANCINTPIPCSSTSANSSTNPANCFLEASKSAGNSPAVGSSSRNHELPNSKAAQNGANNGSDNHSNRNNAQRLPPGPANNIMREEHPHFPPEQPPNQPPQRIFYQDYLNRIYEVIGYGKYARCRQRFVVPVMMFRGKFICRSGTISVMPETYGRYAIDCFTGTSAAGQAAPNDDKTAEKTTEKSAEKIAEESAEKPPEATSDQKDELLMCSQPMPFSYDEVIRNDVQLLNILNIKTIADLMVENHKIKYFMTVSSSEKADSSRHYYAQFNILSLPYPGCEFFTNLRENNYSPGGLYYDWSASMNDAEISIPATGPAADLDIKWEQYCKWDIVTITQNYLKAMLRYLKEEESGLLVHCISGWDRTPLFISLLRLSLWADGLIHQSLDHMQITYLTVAYDWYLFGHQLPDRVKKNEDIMVFCFEVLKFLHDDQFSLLDQRKRTKTRSSSSGSSSIIILKQDDEASLRDEDSNDSYSNMSTCDMSITETFYAMTTAGSATSGNSLTNRSPNSKRSRTSPISVPGMSATRQRQESTSSNGSWQVVTETGSIDSVATGSYMKYYGEHRSENIPMATGSSHGTNGSLSNNSSNNSSSNNVGSRGIMPMSTLTTTTEEIEIMGEILAEKAASTGLPRPPETLRTQRLKAVRALFLNVYGKTAGFKFKEGSGMTITKLIGSWF